MNVESRGKDQERGMGGCPRAEDAQEHRDLPEGIMRASKGGQARIVWGHEKCGGAREKSEQLITF